MPGDLRHFANPSFWTCYQKLPVEIQELADKNFELLKSDSQYPSLHLKKVGRFWSARVGRNYRSLAVETVKGLIGFRIGSHSEYDKLVR